MVLCRMVKIGIGWNTSGDCIARPYTALPAWTLETDAPVDNQGKGESFSPTDLVATALGTCAATTMAIHAQRQEIDLTGMKMEVTKEMTSVPPRRIARLTTEILDARGHHAQ